MARLVLNSGEAVGLTAGSYTIFGTSAGAETIEIDTDVSVTLDASFNRGGDTIKLAGDAGSYTVVRSGSSIVLTSLTGGGVVTIPVGAATTIAFADATRTLSVLSGQIDLGGQTVTTTAASVTPGGVAGTEGTTYVLTTGEDVVGGTALDDRINGSSTTFSVGDQINGGAGTDTLRLILNESVNPYAGQDVTNVENIEVRALRTTTEGDAVVLNMTNISGVESLTVYQSTGDFVAEDVQAGVDLVINDVAGDVTIDYDAQNAPAVQNISMNEFGASANEEGASTLTIDQDVDTVNINDASSGPQFYNNFLVEGGFSELNIDGGNNGAELIVEITSSADTLTVDMTENEADEKTVEVNLGYEQVLDLSTGDSQDDITLNGTLNGVVNAGEGDDFVDADDVNGTINLGNGDNDLFADDLGDDSVVTAGDGADSVSVDTGYGSVTLGAGEDTFDANYVEGTVNTGDDSDVVEIGSLDGSVDAGAGDDEVYVSFNSGSVSTGEGDDYVGSFQISSGSVDTGVGDDVVATTFVQSSTIGTGDGADQVDVFYGANDSSISTGADADDVRVQLYLNNSDVDLGTGDDTVTFDDFTYEGYEELVREDSTVAGGSGDDTMNIIRTRPQDFVLDGVDNLDDDDVEDPLGENRITGIEHLNITVLDTDDGYSDVVEGSVDLSAFDGALVDINIDVQGPEWGSSGGDAADFDLFNLDGEVINVTSVESSALQNDQLDEGGDYDVTRAFEDDSTVEDLFDQEDDFSSIEDVTLNLSIENDTADDTVKVNILGTQSFDIGIYDDEDTIENLELSVDTKSHTIDLGGDFDSVTVTGGAAGTNLNLLNIDATSVVANIASNVYIDLDSGIEVAHDTITTGTGNDVVNAIDDVVDFDDIINLGAGRDRLIVSQSLGNIASEDDSLFETKTGIEELQFVDTDGQVLLDDDALATGVDTVILTGNTVLDIEMGNDFEAGLTVNVEDQSDFNLVNDTTDGTGQYDITVNVDASGDADTENLLNFVDAGVQNTVKLNVAVGADTLGLAATAGASADDLVLTIGAGDGVDTITFADAALLEGDNGAISLELDTSFKTDSGTLVVNAAGILDDDDNVGTGGLNLQNGDVIDEFNLTVTGSANSDTVEGTNLADTFNLGAGDDTVYADAVDGEGAADLINLGAGDDFAVGGQGADTINGGDGDDSIFGGSDATGPGAPDDTTDGADIIDAGAGDDFVYGGAGNDRITLGSGADTVVFSHIATYDEATANLNVQLNGRDTVTDFNLVDGDALGFGNPNGSVLDLDGANGTVGAFSVVESIELAGGGRATLDGEVLVVQTQSVGSENNATVAGWLTAATDGGVVVTGNEGAHTLYVWNVNNSADGDTSAITGDDISLVGVITLAGNQTIADFTVDNLALNAFAPV